MITAERLQAKAGIYGIQTLYSRRTETLQRYAGTHRASMLEISSPALPGQETETPQNPRSSLQRFTTPEICRRLSKSWEPRRGVPALIHEQAQFNIRRTETERLEAFIYFNGIVHLPRKGTRLEGSVFRDIKIKKTQAGQWQRIKPSVSIFDPVNGTEHGIPEAWTLTPEYWQEVIFSELESPRYRFGSKSTRHYPRKPRKPSRIPPETAEYLQRDTGLLPAHLIVMELIYGAGDYDSFLEALKGWRHLSVCIPGRTVSTSWRQSKKCGRLYCHSPALQQIPRVIRFKGLTGMNRDPREVDFTGCHLNLIRSIAGLPPQQDPWKELTEQLRDQGYPGVSRDITKSLITPVMYGSHKGQFCKVNGSVIANPGELYDWIRRTLPQNPQPVKVMRMESRILLDVLARMKEAGIPPGLSIHDSVFTEYPEIVKPLMLEISEQITGHPQPVTVKSGQDSKRKVCG